MNFLACIKRETDDTHDAGFFEAAGAQNVL